MFLSERVFSEGVKHLSSGLNSLNKKAYESARSSFMHASVIFGKAAKGYASVGQARREKVSNAWKLFCEALYTLCDTCLKLRQIFDVTSMLAKAKEIEDKMSLSAQSFEEGGERELSLYARSLGYVYSATLLKEFAETMLSLMNRSLAVRAYEAARERYGEAEEILKALYQIVALRYLPLEQPFYLRFRVAMLSNVCQARSFLVSAEISARMGDYERASSLCLQAFELGRKLGLLSTSFGGEEGRKMADAISKEAWSMQDVYSMLATSPLKFQSPIVEACYVFPAFAIKELPTLERLDISSISVSKTRYSPLEAKGFLHDVKNPSFPVDLWLLEPLKLCLASVKAKIPAEAPVETVLDWLTFFGREPKTPFGGRVPETVEEALRRILGIEETAATQKFILLLAKPSVDLSTLVENKRVMNALLERRPLWKSGAGEVRDLLERKDASLLLGADSVIAFSEDTTVLKDMECPAILFFWIKYALSRHPELIKEIPDLPGRLAELISLYARGPFSEELPNDCCKAISGEFGLEKMAKSLTEASLS